MSEGRIDFIADRSAIFPGKQFDTSCFQGISWLNQAFPAFPAFLIHLGPALRLRAFAPLRSINRLQGLSHCRARDRRTLVFGQHGVSSFSTRPKITKDSQL